MILVSTLLLPLNAHADKWKGYEHKKNNWKHYQDYSYNNIRRDNRPNYPKYPNSELIRKTHNLHMRSEEALDQISDELYGQYSWRAVSQLRDFTHSAARLHDIVESGSASNNYLIQRQINTLKNQARYLSDILAHQRLSKRARRDWNQVEDALEDLSRVCFKEYEQSFNRY
jgi:hypothetical protein